MDSFDGVVIDPSSKVLKWSIFVVVSNAISSDVSPFHMSSQCIMKIAFECVIRYVVGIHMDLVIILVVLDGIARFGIAFDCCIIRVVGITAVIIIVTGFVLDDITRFSII